jgi:hypothetical protein
MRWRARFDRIDPKAKPESSGFILFIMSSTRRTRLVVLSRRANIGLIERPTHSLRCEDSNISLSLIEEALFYAFGSDP